VPLGKRGLSGYTAGVYPSKGGCEDETLNRRTPMDAFENVTAVKKANVYFGGKVTSRTILFPSGEKKTLGIMLAGDYEFSTGNAEIMEVLSGSMDVLLPGETEWKTFAAGTSYTVKADSSFKLRVPEIADYCCSYLPR